MQFLKTLVILSLTLLALISCSGPKGPVQVLTEFIDYRLSSHQSKEKLLDWTTGELHEEISLLSEEELVPLFDASKYKKKSFRVTTEKCTQEQCFLTYTLIYDVMENAKKSFVGETRKIAELAYVEGFWKIVNIESIKTFIDSKDPLIP